MSDVVVVSFSGNDIHYDHYAVQHFCFCVLVLDTFLHICVNWWWLHYVSEWL